MKKSYTLLIGLLLLFNNISLAQQINRKEEEEEAYEKEEKLNERNEYVHAHSTWFKEMLKPHPNLQKAEKAFHTYFSHHADEDSKLKDRFQTWIQTAGLYKDKNGFGIPYPFSKRKTYANTTFAGMPAAGGSFGTWKMIGPANMARTQCNNSNLVTGGFCDRVYVNPYNTQNLFAGFSYGGLWVSKDQGGSWQLTDGSFPNGTNTYANRDYYYGEIAANNLNSDLVYAATEAGLLKSSNGGINWTLLPQLNRNSSATERPYFIALATNDSSIVLSTFGKKVYRSTNGGTTWTMVFDNSSGGGSHTSTSQYTFNTPFGLNDRTFNFFGLEANYNNSNEFYLGVWNAANQACIYKSTNKGVSFSLLLNLNTALSTSWNQSTMLCLKTIPSSAAEFSVFEQFASNKPRYRYSSTGTLLSTDTINAYVEAFDIDWNNKNIMYQGQYSPNYIQKSINSGTTFAQPDTTSCKYLHPDIRGISAVGNIVLIGNDGGLGISKDGGKSIAGTGFEINSMDMWGFSSSVKSDICLTGLDHNQTFVRSYAAPGGWKNIKGADAGVCTINPYNDHWLYYDWAYGVNKGYLNNDGTVTESAVAADVDLGSLQFHSNLAFNIFGIKKSNNNIVVQSSDNMTSASTFKDFAEKVNAIRIAGRDPKTMYVLLSNNKIKKTNDSGTTWVDVTPSPAASNSQTNITAIDIGKMPGELWAAYGNAQNTAKVLHSTDGGSTWTNITTSNLPAAAVSSIAYQRGTNGGVYIIIITSGGTTVWYRNNSMSQWQQVGNTLPMIGYVTNRLFTVPPKNKIRFGSSRGAWESDLYEPSSVEAGIAVEKTTTSCRQDSIHFLSNAAYGLGTPTFKWSFPGGNPATSTLENPSISYATPGSYAVSLTITDSLGNKDSATISNFIQVQPSQCGIDTFAGKATDLSANDNYYNITPINTLNTSNVMTMTMWIKPNNIQTDYTGIFINNALRTGVFVKNGTNELGYMWNDNYWSTNTGLQLPVGQWSHVAWVIKPDSCLFYLNGKQVGIGSINDSLSLHTTNWQLGTDRFETGAGSRNFDGQMDEVCIYNRALTQGEIRDGLHLTRSGNEQGLVAYYQFNESSPVVAYNKVGSSNATAVGTVAQVVSTGPFSSGVSQRMTVNAPGTYNFSNTGVALNFGAGTLPNGEIVVSRLFSLPNGVADSSGKPSPNYWIVRSWGTNDSISTLNNIIFSNIAISTADAANPSLLNLYKRGANAFGNTWGTTLCPATAAVAGTNGTVTYGSNCNIHNFGQFIIYTKGTSFTVCNGGAIPPKSTWITTASSEETIGEGANNGRAIFATDGDTTTYWHTQWYNQTVPHPHDLIINLGTCSTIGNLSYLPRQDGGTNGTITGYEIYISTDSLSWAKVANGTWPSTGITARTVSFTPTNGRYVKLHSLSAVNNGAWSSAAEINLGSGTGGAALLNNKLLSQTGKVLIYPNPVSNTATVQYHAAQNGNAILHVTDVTGKILMRKTLMVSAGINSVSLSMDQLPGGSYILTITHHGEVYSQKFVVNR
ncbi:putative secreted protein (Por secretion system target) [Chitinophaga niastensis]|uniref:Putative secreted protein (Por secretion system target) n=1 Tax=Chitinophaga niastensis TaxID=536980 RepID=A0A2P8H902_CHINA|nr:LamG-like jellyroll fold domain-containing protein [Chitinophaga niastensis]PSL42698.1 putative secreted protein (Por secretion system target) [Chitinophaga niastensis]